MEQIPIDLMHELKKQRGALERFKRLPESERLNLLRWIDESDDPERRLRRIRMVVEMLLLSAAVLVASPVVVEFLRARSV